MRKIKPRCPEPWAWFTGRNHNKYKTDQMKGKNMTKHKTGTREEWFAARLDLLKAEKELTRRSDELTRQRQEPAVGAD